MFGKKKKFSTSRFAERAIELDTFHLFTDMPMTAAISRVVTVSTLPHEARSSAYAIGVFHDIYGGGRPLLPVEIEFDFSSGGEGSGWGEVWADSSVRGAAFYRARIVVADPGAHFFNAVQTAVEHTAVSGNQFLHLVFRKKRKKPYDVKTDQKERSAEGDRLDALMRRIDASEPAAEMPRLEFDTVLLEDAIYTKAPTWSHAWEDGLLDRAIYHSPGTAKWRARRWRK